jgi:MSHA pilin protein MshA
MNKPQSRGFTLIELIVVVAIIAVLAAIAVPRFIAQTTNARSAALSGLSGAINSAVSLAEAEYITEGYTSSSSATSITMNGTSVAVIAGTGRPAATSAGIASALQSISGFAGTYASGVATFDFSTPVTNCNLTYTASTGAVAITSSGC